MVATLQVWQKSRSASSTYQRNIKEIFMRERLPPPFTALGEKTRSRFRGVFNSGGVKYLLPMVQDAEQSYTTTQVNLLPR
jgi:hypothetical protein